MVYLLDFPIKLSCNRKHLWYILKENNSINIYFFVYKISIKSFFKYRPEEFCIWAYIIFNLFFICYEVLNLKFSQGKKNQVFTWSKVCINCKNICFGKKITDRNIFDVFRGNNFIHYRIQEQIRTSKRAARFELANQTVTSYVIVQNHK